MTVRIDRIRVNRGGPLKSDFEFESGDLNLIYGKNEMGKTYLVESLIRFLFKTNRKAPVDWDLRGWDIKGKAIVSGLKSNPITFSESSEKLEDYWGDGTGLPRDFSRLLVVRAGETLLAEANDGVGRDILKDHLSGEGFLDRVADNISKILKRAEVRDRRIVGINQGEVNARIELESRLGELQALLKKVEEGYTCGEARSLRKKKRTLDDEVECLEKAKRYHATQLDRQIKKLEEKKERDLPEEEKLWKLDHNVGTHESKKEDIRIKSRELQELESTGADFAWAEAALGVYTSGGGTGSVPKHIFLVLAALSLLGTVVFGLIEQISFAILSVVLTAIFVTIWGLDRKKGENRELKKVEAEFRTRFGSDLRDRATLQAKKTELGKNKILADSLREKLQDLRSDLRTSEGEITETLRAWTNTQVPQEEWRDHIRDLKKRTGALQDQIDSIRDALKKIHIRDDEYLDEDPGEEWDPHRADKLTHELEVTVKDLEDEEERLAELKYDVSVETGLKEADWDDQITRLSDKREKLAQKYRELTAEILAKIQVHTAIEDLRQKENSTIADGLKRVEFTGPLHAITGRYVSIRLDDGQGLLVSDNVEEYPLASMSSGAREQIFLALRMGFASIAMEGNPGFLILDDAFQHSDWDRRKNLVERTLSFVKSGWQVFYFTMDDHIRDLFQNAGAGIADGCSPELQVYRASAANLIADGPPLTTSRQRRP